MKFGVGKLESWGYQMVKKSAQILKMLQKYHNHD